MQLIFWFLCVCVTWIWCNIKNLKRVEFLYRSNVLEPQEDSHVNVQLSIFISFSTLETCIPRPFLKTPRSEYWKKETALSPIEPSRFWPALVLGGVRTVLGAFFSRKFGVGKVPFERPWFARPTDQWDFDMPEIQRRSSHPAAMTRKR